MRRGAYLALDRRAMRDIVDEHGGDLAGALVVLAVNAQPDTGIVRGNIADLEEILGRGRKATRTLLDRLTELDLIEWQRGRGPAGGEGHVTVTSLARLDARPVPKRHRSTGNPQATEPVPERPEFRNQPVPNPCPPIVPTHAATARSSRGNDPETGDRRQETSLSPSDMTQQRAALLHRAGDLMIKRKAENGEMIRSRTRLAAHLERELEREQPTRLRELLERMDRCKAAGQTINLDAFAAALIDPTDPSSKRRLATTNPEPADPPGSRRDDNGELHPAICGCDECSAHSAGAVA